MRIAGMDAADDSTDLVVGILPIAGEHGLLYDISALPDATRRREVAALCAFARNATAPGTPALWGFKEPRALFHLPAFGVAFPRFKFVHATLPRSDVFFSGKPRVHRDPLSRRSRATCGPCRRPTSRARRSTGAGGGGGRARRRRSRTRRPAKGKDEELCPST